MKPSSQYRNEGQDHSSMQRGSNPHVGGMSAQPNPHLVYLTPHHQSPGYGGQGSVGGAHHGSRDFHNPHIQHGDLQPGAIGTHQQLHPAGMGRRRTSGRLSLLRDIGVAGERDRAESSINSSIAHGYDNPAGLSQINATPMVYGGRPAMTMMSSMVGLPHMQKPNSAGPPQPPSSNQHRVMSAPTGQHSRPSAIHPYHAASGTFLLPGPTTIESEPVSESTIKEELKPSSHTMGSHYSNQLMHSSQFTGMQVQSQGGAGKSESAETETMPSKDSLLQAMEKVDKEIQKVTNEVKSLERKQQHLQETAKKPHQTERTESPKKVDTKHKDLWQVIYAENRRKAEAAKGIFDSMAPRYDMPLYNQPSDTKVYHENLKKNEEMRPKLLAYFQRRRQLSNVRERYLCARYDLLMGEWQKRTARMEDNVKRKAKEAKVREFFEKQFPEIRKQREQNERYTRSGTRGDACRSDADFNEIVDGLSEQEHHEQHMRQLAVVPPMLLDREERRLKFINNNGLVTEPMEDYKKRQSLDHWSAHEKQVFKEKFVQHPKNFHVIASFLEKKSVNDCVLFYYLSKKSVGYKSLVRKNSLKSRKVKPGRGQQSASSNQDASKSGQLGDKRLDKDSELKGGVSLEMGVKEDEIDRIDRPPSPRMTRSRKNLNWNDDDIATAKEGFGKHGKDFAAISRLFANKTEQQIKHFYQNYKKKHSLDQLIGDGKKKKPDGSRRTRTQTTTPSSDISASDEAPAKDEVQAKTGDPESDATESLETPRKRRKENETEKKEDSKSGDVRKVETAVSSAEVESDRSSSSGTSQIRTRRSAADPSKGQAAKRGIDSTATDEPAEKKAKKTKSAKDGKPEKNSEANDEDKNLSDPETKDANADPSSGPESQPGQQKPLEDNNEAEMGQEERKEVTISEPAEEPNVSAESPKTVPESSATTPISSPVSVISQLTPTMNESLATTAPLTSATSEPKPEVAWSKASPKPTGKIHARKDTDGDSSATCSADEEPNMHDVESKVATRKVAGSPYAFEDDFSDSIKLETTRPAMQPVPTIADVIKRPTPVTREVEVSRPASTHAPEQLSNTKQDTQRPQSLPPPPGAVPIATLTFNPASSNNKTAHIVKTVSAQPEARPVRLERPHVTVASQATHPTPYHHAKTASDSHRTIDLTGAGKMENADAVKSRQPQAFHVPPHYHPVASHASSLQKDFAPIKSGHPKGPAEMPVSHPRIYTQSDLDAMASRAAVIPSTAVIPVSSLRAPMQSTMRKEPPNLEHNVKKEVYRPEYASHPKNPPARLSQPPGAVQTHLSRSILTTSSVPTKFVSATSVPAHLVHQAPSDTHRATITGPGQNLQYPRVPGSETAPAVRPVHPPRTSIVKMVPPSTEVSPVEDMRRGAPPQGSIMTGQPMQRPQDDRVERTETILGKRVVVKPHPRASPVSDQVHAHGMRYPGQAEVRHPGTQQKRMGSILEGTPVVQRKHSDDSNRSMSPSVAPYSSMMSRHSPAPKHVDRRTPTDVDRGSDVQRAYQYMSQDAMKSEELHQTHRKTPDKSREPSHQSSSMRYSQAGHLAQHPQIKKEMPSPQVTEELIRRQLAALPLDMYSMQGLAGAHPDLARLRLPHIPLTSPGLSSDLFEVIRQYGRGAGIAGPPLYPFIVPGLGYPPGLLPTLSAMHQPGAVGSPQSDDTSKLLNQDFKTAQLMLNKPPQGIPGATGMPQGFPQLVVSAPGPYQLACQAAGLPVERINFIPSHPSMARAGPPFSPQFAPSPGGRSSTESRHSPSQKASSPDASRRRSGSGDGREFANHPAVKGRNSPASPFHQQRSSGSPHRHPPVTSQPSPTQAPGGKPYAHSHYPHSPARQATKSPHVYQNMPPHAYMDPAAYAAKSGRGGSVDSPGAAKMDQGPYRPRTHSPGEHAESQIKHRHSRQHSDGFRTESKHDSRQYEQRGQTREDRLPASHRDGPPRRGSPRPPKHVSDARNEQRQQSAILMNPTYPAHYGSPKRDTHSPYRKDTPTPKEHSRPSSRSSRMHEDVDSSNPGEDLKTCGRTKMKAGTLIDHIINLNFPANAGGPNQAPSPGQDHERMRSAGPEHRRTPDVAHARVEATSAGPRQTMPPERPFVPAQIPPQAARHMQDKDRPPLLYSLAGPEGMTLAKHSAELIDRFYMQDKQESAANRPTAAASKPNPVRSEPIPADKHPGKPEAKPQSKPPPMQQQHQPQRYAQPAESRPRHEMRPESVRSPTVRAPVPPPPPPAAAAELGAGTSRASLEDIIREALLTTEGSSEVHSAHKGANFRYSMNDMFLSHAAFASLPRHHIAAAMHAAPGGVIPASKPSHAEERKSQAGNGQAQSGSEKYMSALMFRSSPSQARPPAPARHDQQFYQPPARPVHAMPAASQSPAPQDVGQAQGRQIINRPQYEALSDSE